MLITEPDYVRENFTDPTVRHRTRRCSNLELTYIEYEFIQDPTKTTYETIFIYLVREGGGTPTIERDRHIMGLFPVKTWKRLMLEAGFEVEVRRVDRDDDVRGSRTFIGILR